MKKYKIMSVQREFVSDVICNVCGKSCKPQEHEEIGDNMLSGIITNTDFEPVEYSFDICEDCFNKFLDTMIYTPEQNPPPF